MATKLALSPTLTQKNREQFQKVMDTVARELATVVHRPEASFVRTPLLYPSGGTVVVKVDGGPERYFVSDYGLGYDECESMGASAVFNRHARIVAESAGVGFDQHSFFVVEVSRDQLVGAVSTIANCSQEAVTVAFYKHLEGKAKSESINLYERLVSIFPLGSVSKNVDIVGASHTHHSIDAVVRSEKGFSVFDAAVPFPVSISSVVMKFHDLARLEKPPKRIVVVRRKDAFKTYLGVLAQAGSVIETSVPDDTYRKLAA